MDSIAERRLELRTEGGTMEVTASLARPQQVGSEEWACQFEVRIGDYVKSRAMHGGDSMQALQLSMVTLDVELKYAAKQRRGQLFHLDEPFDSILEDSGMQPKRSADRR